MKSLCDQNTKSAFRESFIVSCLADRRRKRLASEHLGILEEKINEFIKKKKTSFMHLHHILQKFLGSWKLLLTWQSQIVFFCSFTRFLLTVFSRSVSRGRSSVGASELSAPRLLAYFWINVWQRASLSLSNRWWIREAPARWEDHTQSRRGRVHIPCRRQIADARIIFPCT